MDLMTALREVLKKALAHDGVARGLREVCRAIAYFCVLADNCTEKQYKQLVEALTTEAKIDLIRVPDNLQLGEWVGLAKYDKSMKVRKAQKCSCVAVTDFGEESEELNFVLQSLKNKQESKQ
jgi:small subunit ribosomal protein S12e